MTPNWYGVFPKLYGSDTLIKFWYLLKVQRNYSLNTFAKLQTQPLSVKSARLHSGHLTLERSREMRTFVVKRLGDSAEIFQDKFITFPVYYFLKLTLTEREMNFFVFCWCTSNCVAPSTPISFVRLLVYPFARSFIHSALKHACIYLFISTVGYILGWFINRKGTSFDDGKRAERT